MGANWELFWSHLTKFTLISCLFIIFRLVYIIGAAVGGRVSFNSNDEHDAMDGELVSRQKIANLAKNRHFVKKSPFCDLISRNFFLVSGL